jgi:hypothetical protein
MSVCSIFSISVTMRLSSRWYRVCFVRVCACVCGCMCVWMRMRVYACACICVCVQVCVY